MDVSLNIYAVFYKNNSRTNFYKFNIVPLTEN